MRATSARVWRGPRRPGAFAMRHDGDGGDGRVPPRELRVHLVERVGLGVVVGEVAGGLLVRDEVRHALEEEVEVVGAEDRFLVRPVRAPEATGASAALTRRVELGAAVGEVARDPAVADVVDHDRDVPVELVAVRPRRSRGNRAGPSPRP